VPHEVLERVEEMGPALAELAAENEKAGQLGDTTVSLLRSAGVIRLDFLGAVVGDGTGRDGRPCRPPCCT